MRLNDQFNLEELTITSTGLKNQPNDIQIHNLKILFIVLQKVCAAINKPIKITSAFRSIELNTAVGGSKKSDHLNGFAADFVVIGMTNKQICKSIIDAGIKFDQLIDECKGSHWVHISIAPAMRNQHLIFNNGKYELQP